MRARSTALAPVALVCTVLAGAAGAAPIATIPCDETYISSAENLMMPPSESIRTYAEGAVRLMWLDVMEPACCSSYLMVVQPNPEGIGEICRIVTPSGDAGFGGIDLPGTEGFYDAETGLTLQIPVNFWEGSGGELGILYLTINQATGGLVGEEVQ